METFSRAYKLVGVVLAFAVSLFAVGQSVQPLAGNPGNVFLSGQPVSISMPPGSNNEWQVLDYERNVVARGESQGGRANLGKLGVGYYRILRGDGTGVTTVAVISPLLAPTPANSPIGVNTSAPWFYSTPEQWQAVMNLATLAGMNWVRDWYHWQELEPTRDVFYPPNRYDTVVNIEHGDGLHNIEVMSQMAAPWARVTGTPPHRFPSDLRDAYNFYRQLAARWRGKVDAFETWNEPDFMSTGAEIASFQKAAYLGFKAGNPAAIVCLSPWAKPQAGMIQDFIDNQVEPYFDVYDFHTYAPVDRLPQFFAVHDQSSAGRPLWVSEFGAPEPWAGDSNSDEPSLANLRAQTEQVPKLFAAILEENVQLAMYFILGDFVEGPSQFGALHKDLTPRPAYLALAAVGRLLAGAHPIGRVLGLSGSASGDNSVSLYAFRAFPDGNARDVIVAWSDRGSPVISFPSHPTAAYDGLGRSMSLASGSRGLPLNSAPVFILFPEGSVKAWASSTQASRITLAAPPTRPIRTMGGGPSPVVLQALFSPDQVVQQQMPSALPNSSVDKIPMGPNQSIQLFAYNFSDKSLSETLQVEVPKGWAYSLDSRTLALPPGSRVQIPFTLTIGAGSQQNPGTVIVRANGAEDSGAVLSFELTH